MKTTLRQFQAQFPTEESCLDHLFQVRYGTDFECPKCHRLAKYSRVKSRRSYQCQWCAHQVYPTAGTPFDRTRTSLRDWFYVMFLFTTTRNGVAAKRVEREIGVTYKTAWRMCHEIRKYMAALDSDDPIGGVGETVQIDETYIGGKSRGTGGGPMAGGKKVVLGMMECGGELVTRVVRGPNRYALLPPIQEHVLPGSKVYTDTLSSYRVLKDMGYHHESVNHSAGQYVSKTGCTVNSIEGFWNILKRGINGTHIHVSAKHLPKYLGEFEYRWNMRHVPYLMLDRLMYSFTR
jgi:transposase